MLNVDYGTRVKAGQVMAVLEVPELELQLQQDDAAIKSAADQVKHAGHELTRAEAQHNVLHLQYDRLAGVAKTNLDWWRSRRWTMRTERTWRRSLRSKPTNPVRRLRRANWNWRLVPEPTVLDTVCVSAP